MNYVPALNGMRAIACVAVVLFHCKISWVSGGFHGVDVFFVLSGFLTLTMLTRDDIDLTFRDIAAFMQRRARRILPLLFFVSAVVGAGIALFARGADLWGEVIPSIGLFSNVAVANGAEQTYMLHTWSVAAEMQFYLAAALITALITRYNRRLLLPLCLAVFVGTTGLRFFAFYSGDPWYSIYFSPILRMSGLFLGGAIALIPYRFYRHATPFGWPALGVMGLAFSSGQYYSAISFTVWSSAVEIASALAIMSLAARDNTRFSQTLSAPWLVRLGVWSYGMYLWNYPLARVLREQMPYELAGALTLLLSTALAALTFRFIETRFTRIGPARPVQMAVA